MRNEIAAVSFGQSIQNILDTIARTVPKIIVFVVILVVGWIVAKVVRRIVAVILHKLHFDRVAERGMVGDALRRSPYDLTSLVGMIFYYGVLLITLQLAFGVFGPNPISTMIQAVVGWLPKAVVAIILIVVASAIAHAVRQLIIAAIGGLSYGKMLANLASIAIIALGVIAALGQIGVANNVTQPVLITVLATVGAILAIGVGGGLVRPMQERWERLLTGVEREMGSVGSEAYRRGQEDGTRGSETPAEAPAPGASTMDSGAGNTSGIS